MKHALSFGARVAILGSALALAACDGPLDFDMRGKIGSGLSTTDAALNATANRPKADDRGIISYPNYQVAIAKRGDTLQSVADRIGLNAGELARYNGLQTSDSLRAGEVIALPKRVAEPSPATGAKTTGPIRPPSEVDITELANTAIDSAKPQEVKTTPLPEGTGFEPDRHKVERGETAYIIARQYGVSVRALADWNGLDRNFTIREGQYLLIPVANTEPPKRSVAAKEPEVTKPGTGSPTPTPPSSTKALPDDTKIASTAPVETPDLSKNTTKVSKTAEMLMPVNGSIIRDYKKGKNEGIDISAPAGTPIKAAKAGTVAAITKDADQVPIIVIRHDNNLMTVYANASDITVKKGDKVSKGQVIGKIQSGASNYVHFEVRKGFDSVDPTGYL